ncbi:MAG: hypothetical protein V1644_01995, partial [Candidatus Micrarchaeota archaeon]
MAVFSKLAYLNAVKRKIKAGKPVSVGVFCTGNSDRSPLAKAALKRRFRELGYDNVKVFSFGVTAESADPQASSPRTQKHAKAMGYDLSSHRSTSVRQASSDIANADLLLGMSPSHSGIISETRADSEKGKAILRKSWSLAGFARKKEWTMRFRGRLARGLALQDPY